MSEQSQQVVRSQVARILAFILLPLLPLELFAEIPAAPSVLEWPQLRGPAYDGVAPSQKLAETWPAEGPPVLWFRELGQGYSSFAVVGRFAYTQYQTLSGQYVVCLEADTGRTIWEYCYDLAYGPASIYPGPRSTPTVVGEQLVWASPDGVIGCLSTQDGRLLWEVNLVKRFGTRDSGFGYSASPVVENGKVLIPVGAKGASVVALDLRDGTTIWQSGDDPASYCSMLPVTFAGRRLVIAFLENVLAGFDLETGEPQWRHALSSGYDEHAAAPLYAEPLLLISSPFRAGATVLRLVPPEEKTDEKNSLAHAWQSQKLSNDVASSVLVDGYVYGFDLRDPQSKAHRPSRGEFRCLQWKTGKVMWSSDQAGHASVVAADGKLVLFNDKGEVILIRQTPEQYEELGRIQVFGDEICWTSPALAHGRLFLRTQARAACVFLGVPESLAAKEQQHATSVAKVARGARADLTRLLGGEREHPFVRPDSRELAFWYWSCLGGALGVAAVLAGLTFLLLLACGVRRRQTLSRGVYWIGMLLLGIVATPVGNAWSPDFIFTWPASLFAVFELTLLGMTRANNQPPNRSTRWTTSAIASAFLGLCLVYFLLCRRLSLAHEPAFLFGFFPAWPVAVWAVWKIEAKRRLTTDLVWSTIAFTAYFWGSAALLLFRSYLDGRV